METSGTAGSSQSGQSSGTTSGKQTTMIYICGGRQNLVKILKLFSVKRVFVIHSSKCFHRMS